MPKLRCVNACGCKTVIRRNLTPPSSGRPKAAFGHFAPPLMSNVRSRNSHALRLHPASCLNSGLSCFLVRAAAEQMCQLRCKAARGLQLLLCMRRTFERVAGSGCSVALSSRLRCSAFIGHANGCSVRDWHRLVCDRAGRYSALFARLVSRASSCVLSRNGPRIKGCR